VTSGLYVGGYQYAFTLVTLGNFVCECANAQIRATEESVRLFELANVIVTCIFCLELLVNMLATMVKRFMSDWWNWFDVLIVALSLVDLFLTEPTSARVVRMARIIRGESFSSRSVTG
jgi:hypothetical protein